MGYTLSRESLLEKGFAPQEINSLYYWRSVADAVEIGGSQKVLIFNDENGFYAESWPSLDYRPAVIPGLSPDMIIHERVYLSGFEYITFCGLNGVSSCKIPEVNCARCVVLRRASD